MTETPGAKKTGTNVTTLKRGSTNVELAKRNLSDEDFRVLKEVIFGDPSPKIADLIDEAILLAYDYCKARDLDIMKRPVAIVPMWDSKRQRMVPKIWGTIFELRATASRTQQHAGKDAPEFGDMVMHKFGQGNDAVQFEYPEWCKVTVYRMVGRERVAFTGQVWWLEAYKRQSSRTDIPNLVWMNRARGQLATCAEAEALRAAFPEEAIGLTADEMEGGMIDITDASPRPQIEEQAEEKDPFELVKLNGEVVEFDDLPAHFSAFCAYTSQSEFQNAEAAAIKGFWETNAPTFEHYMVANMAEQAQEAEETIERAYGKAAMRDAGAQADETTAKAAQTEKPGDVPRVPEEPGDVPKVAASPLHGGHWGKWVPWFIETLKGMPESDRDEFVGNHIAELTKMKNQKAAKTKEAYALIVTVAGTLGLTLPTEEDEKGEGSEAEEY